MSPKNPINASVVERPRYYPRQLITADDLTLEQDYVRDKMRRHNRFLHGWGVVCGATVEVPASKEPWKVVVKSGYILGPYGDEIWIARDVCIDLRTRCYPAPALSDDVCACEDEPAQQPSVAGTVHVAVRYAEVQGRPVRVAPVGCGCEDTPCEYSRWRDGYEICVIDECPEMHGGGGKSLQDALSGPVPQCPPMPTDPWVVLAAVSYDATGKVDSVTHCACRRHVAGFGNFWWECNEPEQHGGGGELG